MISMRDNIAKIAGKVRESEAGAILITSPQNRYYATGFRSSAGSLVVTGEGAAALFIDARYFEEASEKIKNAKVVCTNGAKTHELINAFLAEHGVTALAVEEGSLSYAEYTSLDKLIDARFLPGQKLLTELRMIKTSEELDVLIHAQRIAEKSYRETIAEITLGVTEREIAAELTCRMLRNGAEDKSFDPIVVSGSLSSVPHGKPRDIKIQRGFLTMDFGALYEGYCSDTTRTVAIGEPTEEMLKVYYTVLKAQTAAIEAARAGLTGKELDGVARGVIAEAGYGEYFSHSLSHGVGIDIHEAPNAAPSATAVLPAGAVISIEPGIYIPGKFGVRIEDVIWLMEGGNEDITDLSSELSVLCS